MLRLMRFGTIPLLLLPVVAWSQEPPSIVPGSRIRITEAGNKSRAGTLVTAGADTVVLQVDSAGATATFAVTKISELEVSRGLKGHAGTGLALGFLAGVGAGALVGRLVCGDDGSGCSSGSDDMTAPVTAVAAGIGGVVGLVTGAVIGANHKTERWEAVPSSNWHLSTVPRGPGRFALALSVRF